MNERSETFEASMKRLDEIVKRLEQGDAPLEESLALFEEGTGLVKRCNTMLEEAALKVSVLTQGPDGTPFVEPFQQEPEA